MEVKLAAQIAVQLSTSIKKNGQANLLVSGGSTPVGMFHLLSLKQLEWDKVTIGLVDERYVPSNDKHSNEKLVRENLLINEAAVAHFMGLLYITHATDENIRRANIEYARFQNNIDVCVLGMGEDGHTASLFPNDQASEADLIKNEMKIIATRSPQAPQERISCSKGLILISDIIYIMICGATKKSVLQTADAKQLPISYITHSNNKAVEIFYSENN